MPPLVYIQWTVAVVCSEFEKVSSTAFATAILESSKVAASRPLCVKLSATDSNAMHNGPLFGSQDHLTVVESEGGRAITTKGAHCCTSSVEVMTSIFAGIGVGAAEGASVGACVVGTRVGDRVGADVGAVVS